MAPGETRILTRVRPGGKVRARGALRSIADLFDTPGDRDRLPQ